jgi:hypothetical protein
MGKDRVNTYAETGVPGDTVIRPGSSTTYMSVYFSDYDQDYVNVGAGVDGKIWVTTNGSGSNSWDDGHANQTESDGYLRYWFDPECSPLYLVGPQQWKGGIESDACYENLGGNSTPYGLTVEGNLNSSIESPQQGNVSTVGEMLYTRYNVTGDCGELVNETSTTVEYRSPAGGWESYSSNDEGDGWYNYDWDTSFHIGGWYDIRVNTSKTYYTANSSTWDDWFYLTNTPPSITDANVTPSAGPWGGVYEYSVNIWDTQQDNVTCELWVSTDGGSNYYMKNSTIIWGGRDWCNLTVGDALDGTEFNCSDIGTDNLFHFRIDDETNVNYTNNISGPNLTANTAMITYRFGNNSNISRDDALSNYLAEYTVYVNDTDRVGPVLEGTQITFWTTYNNSVFDNGNSNTTNSSADAVHYFNPKCSGPKYEVGSQEWDLSTDTLTSPLKEPSSRGRPRTSQPEAMSWMTAVTPRPESAWTSTSPRWTKALPIHASTTPSRQRYTTGASETQRACGPGSTTTPCSPQWHITTATSPTGNASLRSSPSL